MRRIGLLGGMSWESTVPYYTWINEGIKAARGGLHSAELVLFSVNFAPIEAMQHRGDWHAAGASLAAAAQAIERAGAGCLVLATNTMHKIAPAIEAAIDIPLLHIADATGRAIQQAGIGRIGLLGTDFTMSEPFYKGRLEERFGLDVIVPEAAERQDVHRIIYDELCLGTVDAGSRTRYLAIIDHLAARGAEGVILGCTEITLLVQQTHTAVPLFDTTRLHADAAVAWALGDNQGAEDGI